MVKRWVYHSDNSDVDNLITKIGDLDLNENQSNFIDLKINTIIKEEMNWNPNVIDIPWSSRTTGWDKPVRGYAWLSSMRTNRKYTPLETIKNEPINPFGVYLDLDCTNNIEEVIDKWETTLRITITVNKMDYETAKHFIERSLVNSVLRFWQNINEGNKAIIFDTDNSILNLITRATEAIRLEFVGEENLILFISLPKEERKILLNSKRMIFVTDEVLA